MDAVQLGDGVREFGRLTEGAVTTEAGSLFQYFTTSPKSLTLSFGDGSYLGVPFMGAL